MSKIEWNPRKKAHIDFVHVMIQALHAEIFQDALDRVHKKNPLPWKELETKITLYKKYSRRLKILEL
tara:strand:+ start:252 stop:452 length:201 start_codon:yes stop_codon:yes gene_type:complete